MQKTGGESGTTSGTPGPLHPVQPADIVARIEALPPLSETLMQLSKELGATRSDAASLEKILSGDPGMAANVLRVANSVHYRGAGGAPTLRDAVVRLGRRGLFDVTAGVALKRSLPKSLDGYGVDAAQFLRHSVAVAVLSQKLSRKVQFVDRDIAFTAGLLHDVGKLVVSEFLVQHRAEQASHLPPTLQEEHALLGIDHGEVGFEIGMWWRLPGPMMIAARWHHAPLEAPDSSSRKLAGVVCVADQLDRLLGYPGSQPPDLKPEVLEMLGVRAKVAEELVADAKAEIDQICGALG